MFKKRDILYKYLTNCYNSRLFGRSSDPPEKEARQTGVSANYTDVVTGQKARKGV